MFPFEWRQVIFVKWEINEKIKEKRSFIYPNFGFQKQLKKLEVKLGLITVKDFEKEAKEKLFFLYETNNSPIDKIKEIKWIKRLNKLKSK